MQRLVFLLTLGVTLLVCPAIHGSMGGAWAQDLTFSAKVDKTSVGLGDPVNLTVTLSGDIGGIHVPALEFPEGFAVAARSQSTNFSIRAGVTERSMSLLYVLIPQRAGKFQLGPFKIAQRNKTLQTEPIDITVGEPAAPPATKPQGGRFIL